MSAFKKLGIAVAFGVALCISTAIAQIVISPPAPDIHINGHTYTNNDWQANPQGTLSALANDIGAATQQYPQGKFSPRVTLSNDLTMFVGGAFASDLNNCLVGNPCASIQRPFDLLRDKYDFAGRTVTVQVADGSYSPGVAIRGKMIGQLSPANLILQGNNGNPDAVFVYDTRPLGDLDSGVGSPIYVGWGGAITVGGMRLIGSYRALWAHEGAAITFGFINFGSAADSHIVSDTSSEIRIFASYSISSGSGAHYAAYNGGNIYTFEPASPAELTVVTIANNPSFGWFALAIDGGRIFSPASRTSFAGAVGPANKYYADGLALINTLGSGVGYFPGTCAPPNCNIVNGAIYK